MSDPSTHAPEHPRVTVSLVIAVSATWTISLLSYYAQAQLLAPIMSDFGRGEEAVGWLFSIENAALALSTLAAAGPLARRSRSRTAFLGGVLVVLGNVASAAAGSFELLTAARVVVGIGSGMLGAAGVAAAAGTNDPDRMFAIVTVVWGLALAAEPTVVPYATVPYSTPGGFLFLAGVSLAIFPLFLWLPSPPHQDASTDQPSLLAAPNRSLALIAMGGLFIFEIGQGGVYTFIAQMGERSGLDEFAVGRTLTGTGIAGLVGGVLAAALGSRFGRKWPIAIGLALNVAAAIGLTLGHDATAYVALNLLWNAAYYFVVPYVMGALSAMDDLGRWVVASDGAWTLGDAVGPGVAGSLVERAGYGPLAGLSFFTGLFCIVVVQAVLHRFEKKQQEAESGGS
jgi:predicted MFS family arabinose efflux permease